MGFKVIRVWLIFCLGFGLVFCASLCAQETGDSSDESEASVASAPALSQSPNQLYVDENFGFAIRGPSGWLERKAAENDTAQVRYTKNLGEKSSLPVISVTVDVASEKVDSALDYAKFILTKYQEVAGDKHGTIQVVELPHEIEVNGFTGARFIFDRVGPVGSGMRVIDCKFNKGKVVVSIQGIDYVSSFEENLQDFEEAINSFRFQESNLASLPKGLDE